MPQHGGLGLRTFAVQMFWGTVGAVFVFLVLANFTGDPTVLYIVSLLSGLLLALQA